MSCVVNLYNTAEDHLNSCKNNTHKGTTIFLVYEIFAWFSVNG
jgi:hypothetical protein